MPGWKRIAVAALVGWPAAAAAQGRGEIELTRVTSPIRIDGVMSDSAWGAVPPLALTMYAPVPGGPPSERTEIRVAYDDHYLYAGGWLFDSAPGGIRVNSLYRDRASGDDAFGLVIDGFNDNETALEFVTNPAGVRVDRSISADGNTVNDSWNAVWSAAAQVTEAGWFVEIRIPLATLGFEPRDGRVVMGLGVTRLLSRRNERVTFPAIERRYGYRQPSVLQDVVLSGVTPSRPIYVTPYLLSGLDRTVAVPAGGTGYAADRSFVNEAGADFRYAASDNLHLDASINTDFAQVEADDEQVNLTRFPLFFPEKRQFFQERAGVFEFDLAAGGRLFHSRRIGLAPDRTPIRMLGGVRAVGRSGGWDIAALDVQTARRGAIPGENLGVARARRRVFNPFSYAGGMVTTRFDEGGGYNVAAGLDAFVRVAGNDYLTVRGATTFDSAGDGSVVDRGQLYAQWQRRSSRGLTYFAQFHRVGADYRPELGFLPRRDFSRVGLYSQYVFQSDGSLLRSHGPGAIAYYFFRNGDGVLETYNMSYWWIYELRSGAEGWVEMVHNLDDVTTGFELADGVTIEPGRYRFAELWFNFSSPDGALARTGIDARIGGFYDGWRAQVRIDPTWNLSRHLEIGGAYELSRIRFPSRGTGVDIHVARLRIGTAASARLSATALVQLNSADDRLGMNVRLRYNFREGSDVWLVYDERLNTDAEDQHGGPALPLSGGRVFRVKLTHTFTP